MVSVTQRTKHAQTEHGAGNVSHHAQQRVDERVMDIMADDEHAQRDRLADLRDLIADRRDRMADERDRVADERDVAADERDREADDREGT